MPTFAPPSRRPEVARGHERASHGPHRTPTGSDGARSGDLHDFVFRRAEFAEDDRVGVHAWSGRRLSPLQRPEPWALHTGRIQPKLKVGAVNDPSEREADRIADEIVRGSKSSGGALGTGGSRVQLKCAGCEREEDEPVRRKAILPVSAGASAADQSLPAGLSGAIHSARGGRELDSDMRRTMEPRLGMNLSRVRIHDGPRAARLAEQLQARAFTVGSDVFFGPGEFRPAATAGKRLLAHELVHVVQQRGGSTLAPRAETLQRAPKGGRDPVPQAFERALSMLSQAKERLRQDLGSEVVRGRFGDAGSLDKVEEQFKDLASELGAALTTTSKIVRGPSDYCGPNVEAAYEDGKFYLCSGFLTLARKNVDDAALTLIHEAGHSLAFNDKFDVYQHTRLYEHLGDLDGTMALVNPDSLAEFVEFLAKGSLARKERQKREEKRGYQSAPQDEVTDAPSRSAESLIHRAIAWAEAKVDAADTTVEQLEMRREESLQGPSAPYDRINSKMVLALLENKELLRIEATAKNDGPRIFGVEFPEGALDPLKLTIVDLKKKFSGAVKAIVVDREMAKSVEWHRDSLTLSRGLFGARTFSLTNPALSFLAVSEFWLSSAILAAAGRAMEKPEAEAHVKFIDAIFGADKRKRGEWAATLFQKRGPFTVVSPF
ncbi:eCIS core domain-containing protein [Nannocystis pusilla]|uniref:eCIS core domain-containing protein n=1 Tax=Nannocystis pusilla TaxID=889268 RepID=UPI003DA426BC